MKNQNGITLIRLSIIILVSIILIIVCINVAINSYKIYKLNKYISKMELIQEKINSIRDEYKSWNEYNPNETGNFYLYMQELKFVNANSQSNLYIDEFNDIINNLNKENKDFWDKKIDSIITNYCYFSPESLEKLLGIKNVNLYIIVNFYTGNIISKEGIEDINGEMIYRQYDSRLGNKLRINEIYNNNILPKIEIIENKGLSQKVKISLESDYNISEIYYSIKNYSEEKQKCTDLSDYNYVKSENASYFTVDVSGDYEFIVEDTNSTQYSKIETNFNLCNSPVLLKTMKGIYWNGDEEKEITSLTDRNWYNYSCDELKMANAKTEDGNYWVWIPRFCFKESENEIDIEYIFENSNTSTTKKQLTGYKIQEAFTENGNISGFWILKFQSSDENKVLSKPGDTLAIINKESADKICKNYINFGNVNSMLTTKSQLNAIIMISNFCDVKISNNLIHYSGGGTDILDYVDNIKYSSSGNVYGVYDLLTSENEVVKEMEKNIVGRYRTTLVPIK